MPQILGYEGWPSDDWLYCVVYLTNDTDIYATSWLHIYDPVRL